MVITLKGPRAGAKLGPSGTGKCGWQTKDSNMGRSPHFDANYKTKRPYICRVLQPRAQCAVALQLDDSALDNSRFIVGLLEQRERYPPNTWRRYRASVNSCLTAVRQTPDILRALKALRAAKGTGRVRRSRRTSARKAKKLPASDLEKLLLWF